MKFEDILPLIKAGKKNLFDLSVTPVCFLMVNMLYSYSTLMGCGMSQKEQLRRHLEPIL